MGIGGAGVLTAAANSAINNKRCQCVCHSCNCCGQQKPTSAWEVIFGITFLAGFVLFSVWSIATLMEWFDPYPDANATLVQIIAGQFRHLVGMLHRIW